MSTQTMTELSFYANLILAIVGVATLCFLTWQTVLLNRQTRIANSQAELANRIAKVQAYQTRYQMFLEMDKMVVENPELKKVIGNKKYLDDYKKKVINADQAKQFAFTEMVLNICQLSFYHYKDDLNNKELEWIKELAVNEYVVRYWKSGYKCKYRADFEEYINKLISTEKLAD